VGRAVLFFVPKGEGNVKSAMGVADASDAILAPTVGPKAGLIVRKILPISANILN
jgi:hypothetical protein